MGIKDLLRFMKPYIEPIHIKKYAGKRVGIDAYSWLHKGAYSCNMELCLNSDGDKRLQYLKYFMHRINLLRHYKITPVVVFDGGNLPCKAATEQQRCMKRTANRELAMAKLEEGNVNAASELFQRAVSVTPSMAHQLIQILRSENIEFVVAPYEADAQLAYLSSLEIENGGIVAVITEDSDLMAYCCKAIVFKMDKFGNGEEIIMSNVFSSVGCRPSFQNFNKDLFAGMCVLAGCDFLPSIPGIGIVRAHSHVSKYRNLHRVLSVLKIEKGNQMPEDYSKSFGEAIAVFQHARIYDAQTKRLKHMKPIPQELIDSFDEDLDFLGPDVPPSVAIAIAEGNLDPINMVAFDHSVTSTSIPSKTFDQFIRPKSPKASATESCFMVISSHKGITKNVTVTKQEQASNESKYLNEAAALEKMILPSKIHKTQEITVIHDDIPLKVPDNNPFKRRKVEESRFEHPEPISTQVSAVTNNDDLDILCISPDSVSLEILDDYDTEKGRENEICLKQESPIPVVTKEENSELYITISSQDSIDSRPKRTAGGKRIAGVRGRKSEKSNQRNGKTSESNSKCTNTILNFFSRV